MTISRDTNTVLDPSVPGGDTVKEAITKNSNAIDNLITDLNTDVVSGHTALSSGVHGVTGDIVGTIDTQTLSNKSFSLSSWSGGTISNATITGGSISGIIDLAIADGGTGASTAAGARTALGLGTAAVANTGTDPGEIPTVDEFGDGAFLDSGTAANELVQLDGSGKLPAVPGDQLTGIGKIVQIGATRTTDGAWTLTGVQVDKWITVIADPDDASSADQYARINIDSGSYHNNPAGTGSFSLTLGQSNIGLSNNMKILPSATTVELYIEFLSSGTSLKAYQQEQL